MIRLTEGEVYDKIQISELFNIPINRDKFNRDAEKKMEACGYKVKRTGRGKDVKWSCEFVPMDWESVINEFCIRELNKYPHKNCMAYAMAIFLIATNETFRQAPQLVKLEMLNFHLRTEVDKRTLQNIIADLKKDPQFHFSKNVNDPNMWMTIDGGNGKRIRCRVKEEHKELREKYKEYIAQKMKDKEEDNPYLAAWQEFGVYFHTPATICFNEIEMNKKVKQLIILIESKKIGLKVSDVNMLE